MLTDAALRNLKPKDKAYKVTDRDGLYVYVLTSGTVSFRYNYSLVDCDNTSPGVLDYALRVSSQFGGVVRRRGYGNHATLTKTWQEALVVKAFTPCLQFQYGPGKNTADIALALDALEAMFDVRAESPVTLTSLTCVASCANAALWFQLSAKQRLLMLCGTPAISSWNGVPNLP